MLLEDDPNRVIHFKKKFPDIYHRDNAAAFISILPKVSEKYGIDNLFLDHDLGGEVFVDSNNKNTGMEVVRWLVANKIKVDNIYVHSLNGVAAKEMVLKLEDAGYDAIQTPFVWLRF